MHACMYVCMYVCVHVCMYVCVYVWVCVYVSMYVCMSRLCRNVYVHLCMSLGALDDLFEEEDMVGAPLPDEAFDDGFNWEED